MTLPKVLSCSSDWISAKSVQHSLTNEAASQRSLQLVQQHTDFTSPTWFRRPRPPQLEPSPHKMESSSPRISARSPEKPMAEGPDVSRSKEQPARNRAAAAPTVKTPLVVPRFAVRKPISHSMSRATAGITGGRCTTVEAAKPAALRKKTIVPVPKFKARKEEKRTATPSAELTSAPRKRPKTNQVAKSREAVFVENARQPDAVPAAEEVRNRKQVDGAQETGKTTSVDSRTAAKGTEPSSEAASLKEGKGRATKRAGAADFDADENTAFVKKTVAEGKSKSLTLPRLKNFILSHKLGKVGGKKEELIDRVEAHLAK